MSGDSETTSKRDVAISKIADVDAVHRRIDRCRHCESEADVSIEKPDSMDRGNPRASVVTVGEAPSAKAIARKEAFAGHSFTTLHKWFRHAGYSGDAEQLRQSIYQTSALKCAPPDNRVTTFKTMAEHCLPFLWRQLELVNPHFVLMLGGKALLSVGCKLDLTEHVGHFTSLRSVFGLFAPVLDQTEVLILPHPSPLSRLHNNSTIMDQVVNALRRVVDVSLRDSDNE